MNTIELELPQNVNKAGEREASTSSQRLPVLSQVLLRHCNETWLAMLQCSHPVRDPWVHTNRRVWEASQGDLEILDAPAYSPEARASSWILGILTR